MSTKNHQVAICFEGQMVNSLKSLWFRIFNFEKMTYLLLKCQRNIRKVHVFECFVLLIRLLRSWFYITLQPKKYPRFKYFLSKALANIRKFARFFENDLGEERASHPLISSPITDMAETKLPRKPDTKRKFHTQQISFFIGFASGHLVRSKKSIFSKTDASKLRNIHVW